MLIISDLSKAYGQQVLSHFNANLQQQRICIVGPNGSGKSTFLLCLSGLLKADSGFISFNKQVLTPKSMKEVCAIASESVVIPEFLSAKQVISLNQHYYQLVWPEALIVGFNFASHLNKSIDTLSSGNLKKLHLINALMRNSKVLLLDEPNIALDEASVAFLWRCIEQYEGQIIVASNEPILYKSKGFETVNLLANQSSLK